MASKKAKVGNPQKGSKSDPPRRRGKSQRGGKIGYSVEQAGELLGISRASAYAGVKAGDIPHVKVGSLLIVPKGAFHEKFGPLQPQESVAA